MCPFDPFLAPATRIYDDTYRGSGDEVHWRPGVRVRLLVSSIEHHTGEYGPEPLISVHVAPEHQIHTVLHQKGLQAGAEAGEGRRCAEHCYKDPARASFWRGQRMLKKTIYLANAFLHSTQSLVSNS